jgi:hypothetical protein
VAKVLPKLINKISNLNLSRSETTAAKTLGVFLWYDRHL